MTETFVSVGFSSISMICLMLARHQYRTLAFSLNPLEHCHGATFFTGVLTRLRFGRSFPLHSTTVSVCAAQPSMQSGATIAPLTLVSCAMSCSCTIGMSTGFEVVPPPEPARSVAVRGKKHRHPAWTSGFSARASLPASIRPWFWQLRACTGIRSTSYPARAASSLR